MCLNFSIFFLERRGYLQMLDPGMINPWTPYGFPQDNFGHIDPNRTSFHLQNHKHNRHHLPQRLIITIIIPSSKNLQTTKKKENPTNRSEEFAGLLADDVLKTYQCPHISV